MATPPLRRVLLALALCAAGACFAAPRQPVASRSSARTREFRVPRRAAPSSSSPFSRRQLLQSLTDFLPLLPGAWFVYLFSRLPKQYIAASGDPSASSGTGAESWGLWTKDPGPRGVRLSSYPRLKETKQAPAGWTFDEADWWLEEHGLIMEQPEPLPPGKYEVTGDREVTTTLTVFPKDSEGKQKWELANGAKLFDVTHLPCRSARYRGAACSAGAARNEDFPVRPGAMMPAVAGCEKQDHAVLFVLNSQ
ncbi:unnamed protein product [Effrenium voratum]|uniref:Uncharacterized protein n=1 Tax=Effrenium voratum TaxID=2562239 RepID=A0AA36ITF2_9DINO|nr:unnamed protein product [Effrenium voratum]